MNNKHQPKSRENSVTNSVNISNKSKLISGKYFSNSKEIQISPNWKKLQAKLQTNKKSSNKNKPKNMCTKNEENKEIWFDDVDPCLIKSSQITSLNVTNDKLCKTNSFNGLTQCVAIDCEMVGTGFGGKNSVLARVSIVNLFGHCIYDKYVKPIEKVTDYRTEVSGIRPQDLENGHDFKVIHSEVYEIIKNRILVGHSVSHDLDVLFLSHPKYKIRDTSVFFRQFFNKRTPSLKKLSEIYLGVRIQDGEHNSVVDAQAAMKLYTLFKGQWESKLSRSQRRWKSKKKKKSKQSVVD